MAVLKRIMPASEFEDWVLFAAETPIDDVAVHHLPAAQVAMILANSNRDPKHRREPYELPDFLPFGELEDITTPPLSQEDLDEKLRAGLTEVASFMRKD